MPALCGRHDQVLGGLRQQERLDPLQVGDLQEQVRVVGDQAQFAVLGHEPRPSVAPHVFVDLHEQALGHIVAAVCEEALPHLRRRHAAGGGVPQGEGAQAVAMHVFGRFDQIGETREHLPRRVVAGAVHVGQDRAIALDDQGILRLVHNVFFGATPDDPCREAGLSIISGEYLAKMRN